MKTKKIIEERSLYVITDQTAQRGRSYFEVLREAIRGGAEIVQLRDREATDEALIPFGKELRKICDRAGSLLIVNERIDLAKAIGADGLHIGQDDLSLAQARKKIGPDRVIGVSTHNMLQAKRAYEEGADYIGVGPIFKTPTKPDYPPVGLSLIREVRKKITLPFFAIGGIDLSNMEQVLRAGAYGVAVVRAVVAQDDIYGAAQQLKSVLLSHHLSLEARYG